MNYDIPRNFVFRCEAYIIQQSKNYDCKKDGNNFRLSALDIGLNPPVMPIMWHYFLNYGLVMDLDELMIHHIKSHPYFEFNPRASVPSYRLRGYSDDAILRARLAQFRMNFIRELDTALKIYKCDEDCYIRRDDKKDLGIGRIDLIVGWKSRGFEQPVAIVHPARLGDPFEAKKSMKEQAGLYVLIADHKASDSEDALHVVHFDSVYSFVENMRV